MDHRALLEGGAQCAMQPVFEVELTTPVNDVWEQVAEESGVLGQQCFKIECTLDRDQLIQAKLAWRQACPHPLRCVVLRVRPPVANPLKDHP